MRLAGEIIRFFHEQGYVIVATVDADGSLHHSCKGIVEIDAEGHVCLFDLYQSVTLQNLRRDSRVSLTAVHEHDFRGYSLKGVARIVPKEDVAEHTLRAWEEKIAGRLTRRVVQNVREEKGHPLHPEVTLPDPEYLIIVDVNEVVDLRPPHLR